MRISLKDDPQSGRWPATIVYCTAQIVIASRDTISAGESTDGRAAAVICAARRITLSANEFQHEPKSPHV